MKLSLVRRCVTKKGVFDPYPSFANVSWSQHWAHLFVELALWGKLTASVIFLISGGKQNQNQPEKPFHCNVCDGTFSRYSSLWSHKRLHSGDKPFKCEVCGLAFAKGKNEAYKRNFKNPVKMFINYQSFFSLSVKKTQLQRPIWKTTDVFILVRNRSSAACAVCNFLRVLISRTTREFTRANVRISAKFVKKHLRDTRRFGIIEEFIPAKNRTDVTLAARLSIRRRIWKITLKFTLVKSHTGNV